MWEYVAVSVRDSVELDVSQQLEASLAGVVCQVHDLVLELIAGFARLGDLAQEGKEADLCVAVSSGAG